MTNDIFALGPYVVILTTKPGLGCPLYSVYLGSAKIGQCISVPGKSDCEWLHRQMVEQIAYAYNITPPGHHWERRNAKRRKNTGGSAPARARWEGHVARKRG